VPKQKDDFDCCNPPVLCAESWFSAKFTAHVTDDPAIAGDLFSVSKNEQISTLRTLRFDEILQGGFINTNR
jgi:hypothetical protein